MDDISKVMEAANEMKEEMKRLRKRDRIFRGLVSGVVVIGLVIGVKMYMAEGNLQASPEVSYGDTNAIPLGSNSSAPSAGGGCGSSGGGGGCCSGGGGSGAGASQQANLPEIEKGGLAYFKANYQGQDLNQVTAKAQDYGCHIQCDIIKQDQVIKSFAYRNGTFQEI